MIEGMRFIEVPESDTAYIQALIEDPEWVMEQKMDGTRVIADVSAEGVHFMQRQGQPLKHAAAVLHLPAIESDLRYALEGSDHTGFIVDGELIIGTGEYHIFDLIASDQVKAHDTYATRREGLKSITSYLQGDRVFETYTASTPVQKQKLLDAARAEGVEGVVVKNLHKPYEAGKTVKHVLKIKFVKSADVVVTKVDRSRNAAGREVGSIQFGVHDDEGVLQVIGACSVIGKPHVEPGYVIEVNFLYWTGSTTYQPRMIRVREDKDAIECVMGQFLPYSRKVI